MKLKCGTCGKIVTEVMINRDNRNQYSDGELFAGEAIADWASAACPQHPVQRASHTHTISYEPMLGVATTRELLNELLVRNAGEQKIKNASSMDNAERHILALKTEFAFRPGGLDYRTVE